MSSNPDDSAALTELAIARAYQHELCRFHNQAERILLCAIRAALIRITYHDIGSHQAVLELISALIDIDVTL